MNDDLYFLDVAEADFGASIFRVDDALGPGWLLLKSPAVVLQADANVRVPEFLAQIEVHLSAGGWASVALAYEAASAFDAALTTHSGKDVVIWAALYDQRPTRYRELRPLEPVSVTLDSPTWDFEAYKTRFDTVRQALADGNAYQVNLTFPQSFTLAGSAGAFFVDRCGVNPPPYAAFMNFGQRSLASFSPEALYERQGDFLITRPMKGTAPAPDARADIAGAADALRNDPKTIAENVMILDMARNDLGRICEPGSIESLDVLKVEKRGRLLQVTSAALGRSSATLSETLGALFPAASITGAPKVESMRLIRELEPTPRGFYCGAIGLLGPGIERFSVAIRTATIEGERGVFGIGSGIVWDSEARAEYDECLVKRDALMRSGVRWSLREALSNGAHLRPDSMEPHLLRLRESARQFSVPLDEALLMQSLSQASEAAPGAPKLAINVELDGGIRVVAGPTMVNRSPMRAILADRPLVSQDPNLRWKTSSRAMLDESLDANPEFDEVLQFNENGLVTEFCYGAVVVEMDGKLIAPRLADGRLPSIGLQALIDEGKVIEAPIPVDALERVSAIYIVNSVVGLTPVTLTLRSENGARTSSNL